MHKIVTDKGYVGVFTSTPPSRVKSTSRLLENLSSAVGSFGSQCDAPQVYLSTQPYLAVHVLSAHIDDDDVIPLKADAIAEWVDNTIRCAVGGKLKLKYQ
jgi:hypothetical protein